MYNFISRFDFLKELGDYCMDDVLILKNGCMKFRSDFIKSSKIDPFETCFTIAGVCMKVFRSNYMEENIIGRIPASGYTNTRQYSRKAIGWLKWIEKSTGVTLRKSATPEGEKYLPDVHVWADGYNEETRHVYMFAG